ncbi:hypothetical protein [Pseudonocardia nigra]|uniref:hypothetical protein n=1 Tax=Pseudonocardia nigra TaxID=1921578 RepID=UPI001C5ECF62|nr:hypothetical protein [Pseudonocardia nigra]
MALPNNYAQAVWDAEGVLATWLPDRRLRVGDVVSRSRHGGGLQVETHVDRLARTEQVGTVVSRAGAERLFLQDGVSIGAVGEAEAPGAGLRGRFARANAFLFAAGGGTVTEYRRLAEVRTALSSLRRRTVWEDGWYLVTAVRSFSMCTLVVGETDGAEVSVQADAAQLGMPTTVRAGAGVTVTGGRAATWVLGPSTPLYEALFVRRRLLRDDVHNAYLDAPREATGEGDFGSDEVLRVAPRHVGLTDS